MHDQRLARRNHTAHAAGTLQTAYTGAVLHNAGTLILEAVGGSNPVELLLPGGTLDNTGTLTVNAGSGGPRTLAANLFNQGTVNIGTPTDLGLDGAWHVNSGSITISDASTPGVLSVTGDYMQHLAGTLGIEIGGVPRPGGADPLAISGNAALDGTLNISMLSDQCGSFEIITFGTRSGDFATMNGLDLGGGRQLVPSYSSNALQLDVIGPTCSTPTPTETETPTETPTTDGDADSNTDTDRYSNSDSNLHGDGVPYTKQHPDLDTIRGADGDGDPYHDANADRDAVKDCNANTDANGYAHPHSQSSRRPVLLVDGHQQGDDPICSPLRHHWGDQRELRAAKCRSGEQPLRELHHGGYFRNAYDCAAEERSEHGSDMHPERRGDELLRHG